MSLEVEAVPIIMVLLEPSPGSKFELNWILRFHKIYMLADINNKYSFIVWMYFGIMNSWNWIEFIRTDTFPLFTKHRVAGQPFNIPLMHNLVLWNNFLIIKIMKGIILSFKVKVVYPSSFKFCFYRSLKQYLNWSTLWSVLCVWGVVGFKERKEKRETQRWNYTIKSLHNKICSLSIRPGRGQMGEESILGGVKLDNINML